MTKQPYIYLKDIRWHFIHIRKRVPFFVHFWTYGLIHPQIDIRNFDYTVKHVGHFEHKVVVDMESFKRQNLELLARLEKDPLFLCKVFDMHDSYLDKMNDIWKNIAAKKDLKNRTNKYLSNLLTRFFNSIAVYDSFILFPLYVEEDLTQKLKSELATLFPKKAEEYFAVITTSVKEGLVTQEFKSLLRIAVRVKRRQQYGTYLKKHINQFSWMANQLYTMDFYDPIYYLDRAKHLATQGPEEKLSQIIIEQKHHKDRYQQILKIVKNNKKVYALMQTVQKSVYFRNFRGAKLYESSKYIRLLLQEIAKRLAVSVHKITYLTTFEIQKLLELKKTADRQIIRQRMKSFAFITNINNNEVIAGKDLEEARKYITTTEEESEDSTTVKGQIGFKGKVQGIVYLIKDLKDLQRVRQGCILVTPSTTPAYVPILNKVFAIVTDEGGILCHAALISREMKIPCVIGTKNSTQVFKDGDMIEVDAIKGIVRKIKK